MKTIEISEDTYYKLCERTELELYDDILKGDVSKSDIEKVIIRLLVIAEDEGL